MIRDKKKRLSGRFISILALIIMICSAGPSFAETSDVVYYESEAEAVEALRGHMKQREETVKILGRIGRITPRIKQSVVIKRYSTVSALDKYQKAAVEHAFNAIVEHIKL